MPCVSLDAHSGSQAPRWSERTPPQMVLSSRLLNKSMQRALGDPIPFQMGPEEQVLTTVTRSWWL